MFFDHDDVALCICSNWEKAVVQPWIIDTGAIDHMCHDIHLFETISQLPVSFKITLPNGNVVPIFQQGTVQLSHSIFLLNVLFVPQFKYNLLSISKLIDPIAAFSVIY